MTEIYKGRLRLFVEIGSGVQEVQGRRLGSRVLNAAYPTGVPESHEEAVMGAAEYLTRILGDAFVPRDDHGKPINRPQWGTNRIGVVYAENGAEHRRYVPDNVASFVLDPSDAVTDDDVDHLLHSDTPPEKDQAEILVNWLDRHVPELPSGYQSGRLTRARAPNPAEAAYDWEGGAQSP